MFFRWTTSEAVIAENFERFDLLRKGKCFIVMIAEHRATFVSCFAHLIYRNVSGNGTTSQVNNLLQQCVTVTCVTLKSRAHAVTNHRKDDNNNPRATTRKRQSFRKRCRSYFRSAHLLDVRSLVSASCRRKMYITCFL